MKSLGVYTEVNSKFGFGQFQSCRNSSILTDSILTILSRLRSANFVALKQPKTQILSSFRYNIETLITVIKKDSKKIKRSKKRKKELKRVIDYLENGKKHMQYDLS